MNVKWTWSIVALHFYFYSHLVLSLHLPASLFISSPHSLYLSCCLSTISPLPLSVWPLHSHISFTSSFPLYFYLPLTSPLPIYGFCPLFFSSSLCSSHLCPLVSPVIGYSFTCFSPYLFPIHSQVLFLNLHPTSSHFPSSCIYPFPLSSPLPSFHSWTD